jgi:ABC-2 type transport system ATP-binding protein
MNERAVAARGLLKRYGHVLAVDGVDLTVEHGDVYGILGPKGTVQMRLLGAVSVNSGIFG